MGIQKWLVCCKEYPEIWGLCADRGFLARFIFDIQEWVLALVQRLHQGSDLEFLLTGGSGHRGEGNPRGFLFASSAAYMRATLCVTRHLLRLPALVQLTAEHEPRQSLDSFINFPFIASANRQT